ncbi:MAG: FHA domain-containing protein, partial [Lachnospiraceae bacterium]|nr:FHA domain-containing protein [Lachnospiraceae bacterium]
TDEMTQTVYMEISPETEERKLYGSGPENRKVISLDKLPLVVGKKERVADVVLQNASISRMHARITEEEGKIYLEDLNATNGTFRNGVRLKPYEKVEILKEDEIKLGKLMFTYR